MSPAAWLAKPAAHEHAYALYGTEGAVVESLHSAPTRHGPLAHSLTSVPQLRPTKPAEHAHWYALAFIFGLVDDSEQAPPLRHGMLRHSLTSTSQFPLFDATALLSTILHDAAYSLINAYAHMPLAKPALHVHRYAATETAALGILPTADEVHVAPFLHGLLAHSFTSEQGLAVRVGHGRSY